MSMAFPDVCKTPAPPAPFVPIPYPNIGQSAQTVMGPVTVTTDAQMPTTKDATYMITSGDEAGVMGGVISSTIIAPAQFMLYSFDVKFEGKNAARVGDAIFHNNKNAIGQ